MKSVNGLVLVVVLVNILAVSGCASNRQSQGDVIVDTKYVDMQVYYQDLHECRNYAAQVNTEGKVVSGAVTGAVVGGAVGAIAGNSDTAKRAAGVGGVLGAVKGSGRASKEKQRVLKNCMRGRGYRVLN